MVKKIVILTLAVMCTAGLVFAQQDFRVFGEMKTGYFWEKVLVDGDETLEEAKMHNNDDAGANQGRFRLNMELINSQYNIGMKVRFEQTAWVSKQPTWEYAFAYGNFIDDQLRVTIGRLGESPWGVGGPDLWNELDAQIGIRTEIMPKAIPGNFNIGFVLNNYNNTPHDQDKETDFLLEMLMETVFGLAYTNDFFHFRFSYRLDGKRDNIAYSTNNPGEIVEDNMEMIYRLEERFLRTVVPGLSIWANGYWKGLGEKADVHVDDSILSLQNFLYFDYSPEALTSQISLGLTFNKGIQLFKGRANLHYNVLPFLRIGTAFNFHQEFGENSERKDLPFMLWGIEPQVRVTFNSNAYIAFVYNYNQQYVTQGQADPVLQERHWLNLRVAYTF